MALYDITYQGENPDPPLTTALVIAPNAKAALNQVKRLIGGELITDYRADPIKTTGTKLLFSSEEW